MEAPNSNLLFCPFLTPKYSLLGCRLLVKNRFTMINRPVTGAIFIQRSLFFFQYKPTPIWRYAGDKNLVSSVLSSCPSLFFLNLYPLVHCVLKFIKLE